MAALEFLTFKILEHLQSSSKPLFVALQGPQGSGKSYLSNKLNQQLSSPPYSLRVAVLSIDDLYLPHCSLSQLAENNPHNSLWQGRGQPGTHDVDLGVHILNALKEGKTDLELPRFDKSLFDGEGDRLPLDGTGVVVRQPPCVHMVILEGWMVGFHSIPTEEIDRRWNGVWRNEIRLLGLAEESIPRKEDVQLVNKKLEDYERLWRFFDLFIQIKPAPLPLSSTPVSQYAIIYKWRLQQEHDMKAKNGGKGMSDAAVKTFVDRYIPGYVFFGSSATDVNGDPPKWTKNVLTILVDESRNVVGTDTA